MKAAQGLCSLTERLKEATKAFTYYWLMIIFCSRDNQNNQSNETQNTSELHSLVFSGFKHASALTALMPPGPLS